MATKEQAIMIQEVYQTIKDNGFKNRHELEKFLLKDREKYKEHLEWVSMDTIYFTKNSADIMIDRCQKILNGDFSWRKSSEPKKETDIIQTFIRQGSKQEVNSRFGLPNNETISQSKQKSQTKSNENGGYER